MTPSTINRLGRVYTQWVGYNPFEDDPSIDPLTVLETLKEWRVAGFRCPDDPAAYTGPIVSRADLAEAGYVAGRNT